MRAFSLLWLWISLSNEVSSMSCIMTTVHLLTCYSPLFPAVVRCPVMSDAPTGGGVNCSHPIAPHSFSSTCEFRCDEGFSLQGAGRIECGHTGQWTRKAPTCEGTGAAPSLWSYNTVSLQLTLCHHLTSPETIWLTVRLQVLLHDHKGPNMGQNTHLEFVSICFLT